jgi:CMP-N-acetylneuraminic acid synthetase
MLCLICARSGSKGLINKNLSKINNKSLLQITIEAAKKIKNIKYIVLSTDSIRIAKIGKKFGATVPFIRPKYLSTDGASEWKVWQHAIKKCEKNFDFNDVIILPVVSPLRIAIDIKKTINTYKKNTKSCIITVCESHRNPYFNMVKLNSKKNAKIFLSSKKKILRRQDAPEAYDMCTISYVLNKKTIKNKDSLFSCNLKAVIIPKSRSIDIDNLHDLKLARLLYGKKI